MKPWETLDRRTAPDGIPLELRRRGHEYLIVAGGYDLMATGDEASSRSLAELGLAAVRGPVHHVLVGGLGMGYTLREALDRCGPDAEVEVAELSDAVAAWNRTHLADLAGSPLQDPRTQLRVADVRLRISAGGTRDAILLDVDNGAGALAHADNDSLYGARGLTAAWAALRPGGVLAIWSFGTEPAFEKRAKRQGFEVRTHRVTGSRQGRGRHHVIVVARRP